MKKACKIFLLGLSMFMSVGCNSLETPSEESNVENQITLEEDYNRQERNIEKFLSEKSGIYSFDIQTIDPVEKNGKYYLVLGGEIISDLEVGRQSGNMVLSIRKENYKKAYDSFCNADYRVASAFGGNGASIDMFENPSIFTYRYGKQSSGVLVSILEDSTTSIYSVVNRETGEKLFEVGKDSSQPEMAD